MIEVIDEGTVYRSDGYHAFHPSLVCLDSMHWVVSHDIGSTVDALDYHTHIMQTRDGGRHWVETGRILPARPDCTHTIRVRRMSDGRLTGFGKMEERSGYPLRCNRDTLGQVPMRLFWVESRDCGGTWSAPNWIEPALAGPTWELCHSLIELPGGDWGAPVATWRDWRGDLPNGQQSGILISHDYGQTWPDYRRTFDGRDNGRIHWEQSVVTLSDGVMLATAWVFDPCKGDTLPSAYVTSEDGGMTWSVPLATGFHAQTCKLLALPERRLLAAYRRHDERGLWLELAEAAPGLWRRVQRFPLWTGGDSGMETGQNAAEELGALKFGYPSMAQLDDGSVVVVYWRNEGERSVIRWLRIAL